MSGWFLKAIGASEELAANVERVQWGWTRPAGPIRRRRR